MLQDLINLAISLHRAGHQKWCWALTLHSCNPWWPLWHISKYPDCKD